MSNDIGNLVGIERTRPVATPPGGRGDRAAAAGFDRLLDGHLRESAGSSAVRWSSHAVDRLAQRQITVSPAMQQELQSAVDQLAAKGGRESLVLIDGVALVVSVTNRTVITAVGPDRMRDQIFTNIDSAVVR